VRRTFLQLLTYPRPSGTEVVRTLFSLVDLPAIYFVIKSVLTQLWCNPDCFNSADFHVGAHVVMKRWQGRLPRGTAHHTDDFADHLVRCAYSAQALKRRSVKIHRSQSRLPPTPATGMQPEDHRNALDRKVLQKTPVGYGAIANVPQVPQVHQSCVRTIKS
jgi:hypothetical protein